MFQQNCSVKKRLERHLAQFGIIQTIQKHEKHPWKSVTLSNVAS